MALGAKQLAVPARRLKQWVQQLAKVDSRPESVASKPAGRTHVQIVCLASVASRNAGMLANKAEKIFK